MVLMILALIWAAALLPPFVRSRLEGNPVESIGRFRRHLRVLESTSPAASSLASDPSAQRGGMPAIWANEARRLHGLRRRQQVCVALLITMAATLVLGLLPALRPLLALHAIADVLFVGYVVALARIRGRETERQMQAHFSALRAEGQTDVTFDDVLRQQAF